MTIPPLTHLQQVCKLYKMILRLHRGLPKDIKELGDVYVKDEFKRHKTCNSLQASIFMKEWRVRHILITEYSTKFSIISK
jgi:hypothetical protein